MSDRSASPPKADQEGVSFDLNDIHTNVSRPQDGADDLITAYALAWAGLTDLANFNPDHFDPYEFAIDPDDDKDAADTAYLDWLDQTSRR